MFADSLLLTPEVFESPELYRVRLTTMPVIPSVVLDSESDRKCFALFLCIIWDGREPAGRVLDFWVDVDMFIDSS